MDRHVQLAKQTVETYVKEGAVMEVPKDLPQEFYLQRAGVFVTLRKRGELRGCIGTFLPAKKNLAEEIISNAIAACSQDPRFPEVTKDELPNLKYEVSILSEPEPIKNLREHHPKKHGIIVRCSDGRCGLLLPDLDGVDSVEQQIFIAGQKGDINPFHNQIQLYHFTVEKHQ